MQKLIAKYGLAAHLAILAVAPLFLFPFCSDDTIAVTLGWLSLLAGAWTVLEPSVRSGERLRDSRRRVTNAILHAPLFWCSLALVVFTGVRALNTGIELHYDAETSAWSVSVPLFPILPGVVGSAGNLPFAAAVACVVLLQACRHSLGRAARMAFFLVASFLSGLAALIAFVAIHEGVSGVSDLLPAADGLGFSFVGFVFGFYLLAALVALAAVSEYRWGHLFLLPLTAIGGNAAGLFAFAPPCLSAALAAASVVMIVYVVAYSCKTYTSVEGLKQVAIIGMSLALGGLLVVAILPKDVLDGRLAAFMELKFFPAQFWDVRTTLSAVAFKSWVSRIWIGSGLDSFPLDFRFAAQEADWTLLPRGAAALPNGWWLLLVEQGIVGAVFFVLPFGFLVFTYFRRLIGGFGRGWELPHPACLVAPIALLLLAADGLVDCSALRVEVLMVVFVLLAVSAASFQRMRGGLNG